MRKLFQTVGVISLVFSYCLPQYTMAQEPFTVDVVPLYVPGMLGVQSFAWGKASDGKILIIGGRRDGLHLRRPFETFDPAFNNKDLIVLDLGGQQVWTAPLTSLPTSIQEQLQSTNMQFYQRDSILYIIGGYGYSATAGDHITFPYLTAIYVDSVVDAIINNKPFDAYFRQVQDTFFQVTGGQLGYLDSFFYLCGGQIFMGRYNPMNGPSFTQFYVEEIRKFRIIDDGVNISIADTTVWRDPANLHRRDYNMSPQIFPDGSHGFTMFTGVFQVGADLPFLNSVNVFDTGYQVVNENIYLSHYHSAKIPIWDSAYNEMHTVFFGGIAQYYMDTAGNLIRNDSVPFVTTISKVTRHSDWTISEYKIGDMPGLVGASSEFIPANEAKDYYVSGEILNLNKLPWNRRVLVGYIIGGINSSAPNIFWVNDGTQSIADTTLYAVFIVKDSGLINNIPVIPHKSPEVMGLEVFTNPATEFISLDINPNFEGSDLTLTVYSTEGKIILIKSLSKQEMPFKLDVSEWEAGHYVIELSSKDAQARESVTITVH